MNVDIKEELKAKVEAYVAQMSKVEAKQYFGLAQTPEWAIVLELGDKAKHADLVDLKTEAIGYLVPGYILSDDELLLLFVAEMTERFYRRG